MKLVAKSILFAAILGSTGVASAQVTQFSGFTLGGDIAFRNNRADFDGYANNRTASAHDTTAQLDFSYGMALDEKVQMTFGVTYDLGKTNFGSQRYRAGSRNADASLKLSQHLSIYAAPGVLVAPNWLLYGKLAYHRARGEYTDSVFGNGKTSHSGYGYGVGMSYAASEHVRLGVEVQQIKFSRESNGASSAKPSMTEIALKFGYRF